MPNQLPALLKVSEVAEIFRVHENTVYKWAAEGVLNPIRFGNAVRTMRFRRADIERLLETEQTA